MTAKDQIKILKHGFMIIRADEQKLKIKAKINTRREWHNLSASFDNKTQMRSYMNELLKIQKVVED